MGDVRPGNRRLRFWRHVTRTLVASGVALGAAAIIGEWSGFSWVSGPAAIGALGALVLAFVVASLPAATDPPLTHGEPGGLGGGAHGD